MSSDYRSLIVVQKVSDLPGVRIPVLYMLSEAADGSIRFEALELLVSFFREMTTCSMTAKRYVARAVELFIAYVDHRWPDIEGRLDRLKKFEVQQVFAEFCTHLRNGTADMGASGETGSALSWPVRSQQVTVNLIHGLEKYLTFVAARMDMDGKAIEAAGIPVRKAYAPDKYERTFSILGLLKLPPPKEAISLGRGTRERNTHGVFHSYTNRFPIRLLGAY